MKEHKCEPVVKKLNDSQSLVASYEECKICGKFMGKVTYKDVPVKSVIKKS